MYNAEDLFKLLSTTNKTNLEFKTHFLDRLKLRAQNNNVVPDNITEIQKILLNRCPVYVDYQGNNEYKVFYDISEKYDLVIILWLRVSSDSKIKLITVYPQPVKRRFNKNGK